ncbi:hypothetical protein ACOMCU_01930 [Lysinibacillus sp. UGB7]|uniref:hypothetical protein n=1 Tax=Lysinibacillus sp. UGB7 TaxID=3411039 RepID=UPI003B807875
MTIKVKTEQITNEELEVRTRERNLHRSRREFSNKRKEEERMREGSRKADTRLRGSKQSRKKRSRYGDDY